MDGGQHLQKVHYLPVQKWTDMLRIQEKKSTKTANITRCLQDFEKPRLFWLTNTFRSSKLNKIIYFYYRARCFHSFKVRDEPHNLKLALCIVSGEVEYAYCGPSCAAGKSGFCNHILALLMKACKYSGDLFF